MTGFQNLSCFSEPLQGYPDTIVALIVSCGSGSSGEWLLPY